MAENQKIERGPQKGPQTAFLSTPADIAIYGGAAGSGKTYSVLLDPLRFLKVKEKFPYTIFRRTTPQITNPGGLVDEAMKLYLPIGASPTYLRFDFRGGLHIRFAHLEKENTVYDWQGTSIPAMAFEELTHFTKNQFFYMLSRLRSVSGFGGSVKATCNPDPDSFVRDLIDWWIDKDGFPIPERSGVIRYFTRDKDKIVWHENKTSDDAKSLTFIPAKLSDNQILMQKDPGYLSNLKALSYVDRSRLLDGNWNVRAAAGMMFKRRYFEIVEAYRRGGPTIRYWDRASSTNPEAAYTVGTKMTKMPDGRFCVVDVQRFRATPGKVMSSIQNIAAQDGKDVEVGIEQDPGQAGVAEAQSYVTALSGFNVKLYPARQDKETRAKPLSAQAEFGNIDLLRGEWNDDFLDELEAFPDATFKDQVDSASGAFNALTSGVAGVFTKAMAQKTGSMGSRGGHQW